MEVTIRKATIKDLKKVQELNLKLFEKEHKEYDKFLNLNWTFGAEGTKYFSDRIKNEDGCVFVAELNKEIVGYLCGGLRKSKPYRNPPIMAELENTLVLENHRSKGIGSKLFDAFINWCKTKKVEKIRVEASAQNKLAISFYRKNGFKDYTLVLEADL